MLEVCKYENQVTPLIEARLYEIDMNMGFRKKLNFTRKKSSNSVLKPILCEIPSCTDKTLVVKTPA